MLKILDYSWHQVHTYRMARALPAQITLARLRYPTWRSELRPLPDNINIVDVDDINPLDYDLAVLHLDQWCDRLNLRAMPYRIMNQITQSIPQIVIMHGTPDSQANRRAILRLMGDLPVVCNSHHAAWEWDAEECRIDKYGQPQFRAIIHGYHDEFFNYSLVYRSLGAITVCGGGDTSREYHGIPLIERLKRDVPLTWVGPRGDVPWRPNYTSYRGLLASSLIYFSPTTRGPMPGARTEAMLSGCCVVSVPGNDWEHYIRDGENGFIVRDYVAARDALQYLLAYPEVAYRIGQQGRKDTLLYFAPERYRAEWLDLCKEIGL